jgi:hypothetical protein
MARQDLAGWAFGLALSPMTGLLSAVRRSRMFHPTGFVCSATAEPLPGSGAEVRSVAARLAGPALMRWSSAWWKQGEWIDVLGCAIRFTQGELGTEPAPDDQDLLLATIQRPWSLPFAPFSTRDHDFLDNAYFGVSPFEVPPLGRIEWRLVAERKPQPAAGTREERLERAIDAGAALLLEWAPYPGPLKRPIAARFEPLLRIQLTGVLELDQRRLRFDPFRSGRGVKPVGLVHHMRRAAYWTSQALRPHGPRSRGM